MNWIKFSTRLPEPQTEILYYNGQTINLVGVDHNRELYSYGYFCNDPKCNWIYDDCGCKLIINANDLWMPLPAFKKEDE